MTDYKSGATYHGSELPQRTPLDTFAQHGAPPVVPGGADRPYVSPGTPPWGSLAQDMGHTYSGRRNWWRSMNPVVKLLLIGALIIVLITLAAIALQRSNVVPAGVPLIGKDSGVAACEAIQHGSAPVGGKTSVSPGDFVKLSEVFADSRYPAIRDNGVKLMDLAAQIAAMGDNPGIGALAYVGAFTDAYAGLAGGCASVGHPIPPMTAN
jgi:hypothetical protein